MGTAAGSAIATKYCLSSRFQLTNNNTKSAHHQQQQHHLVVFGAGLQAELHIECLLHVFPSSIRQLSIVNRTEARANELANKFNNSLLNVSIILLGDEDEVRNTVQNADIIVMATNSYQPLFNGEWLKPGAHINGVGSYTPQMREVDKALIDRCKIIIDTKEARDVGDLYNVNPDNVVGLLGDVIAEDDIISTVNLEEEKKYHNNNNTLLLDCTFFKSVGTAIQDILTGDIVLKKAKELGIGTEFKM